MRIAEPYKKGAYERNISMKSSCHFYHLTASHANHVLNRLVNLPSSVTSKGLTLWGFESQRTKCTLCFQSVFLFLLKYTLSQIKQAWATPHSIGPLRETLVTTMGHSIISTSLLFSFFLYALLFQVQAVAATCYARNGTEMSADVQPCKSEGGACCSINEHDHTMILVWITDFVSLKMALPPVYSTKLAVLQATGPAQSVLSSARTCSVSKPLDLNCHIHRTLTHLT